MRSIAVMNQKGGVGKTTTAVNLSAALAEAGKRVLVIDLDPQAHASLHLGVTVRDGEASMYDVLTGDSQFRDVRQQVGENLFLAPAHLDLAAAEMELHAVESNLAPFAAPYRIRMEALRAALKAPHGAR